MLKFRIRLLKISCVVLLLTLLSGFFISIIATPLWTPYKNLWTIYVMLINCLFSERWKIISL